MEKEKEPVASASSGVNLNVESDEGKEDNQSNGKSYAIDMANFTDINGWLKLFKFVNIIILYGQNNIIGEKNILINQCTNSI